MSSRGTDAIGWWNGIVGRSLRASADVAVLFRPALVRVAESFGASSGGTTPSPGSYFSHLLFRYAWRIVVGLGLFSVLLVVVVQSRSTLKHQAVPTLGAGAPPPTAGPPPEVYVAGLRHTIDGLGLRPAERASLDRTLGAAISGRTCATLTELTARIAADARGRKLTATQASTLRSAVDRARTAC